MKRKLKQKTKISEVTAALKVIKRAIQEDMDNVSHPIHWQKLSYELPEIARKVENVGNVYKLILDAVYVKMKQRITP